ncbi:MAG: ABC transporter substrate-binding protein [Ilumatobacteraceae bacterium]
MKHRRSKSLLAIPIAAALVLAACGDDDKDAADTSAAPAETTAAPETTAGGTETTAAPETTAGGTDTTAGGTDTTAAAGGDVSLADICPSTVSIITDWNPESEHGFLYQMVGEDYSIDKGAASVTGSLMAGDVDTGVDIEVRSGGPAIGYQTVTSQLYADEDILLGYVYTDEAIQNSADFPTVAIESGFEKNPQMIMWDPETYPDVETIEQLGQTDAIVRYFGGAAYMEYFTGQGILSKDQVDGSYSGDPSLFIADEGKAAQQGFGSAEPYLYENVYENWLKPVKYQYINDAGWNNYAESIATKPENIEKYADCFTKLVPIIQQSSVDYLSDPTLANKIIIEAVNEFDNGWVYDEGVADYAVQTIITDGLVANGPDDTVGNFDMDRVNQLIEIATPIYTELGQAPKEGLTAEDIVTNQFIDPSISV